MLDVNEIKNQKYIDSEDLTPEQAAEMSKAAAWAPHVSDGLDALEREISKAEREKWAQVLAKAWTDEQFQERLMLDPPSVLRQFGIELPAGVEVRFVENTDQVRYIPLPPTSFARLPQTWADTWVAITA